MTLAPASSLKIVHKIVNTINAPDFIDTYRQRPQDFTRKSPLDFQTLCLFILNQPQAALTPELNHFFQMVYQSPLPQAVVTAQAFCQARKKIQPEAFVALNDQLQQLIDHFHLRRTWRHFRLLAVDGSSVHLPLEKKLERCFGTHDDLPVGRASVLYDTLDGQVLHSLLVTPDMGERACAAMHLEAAPENSLILYDRGYPSHWLFALHQQKEVHFVMRLKLTHSREVAEFVASGKQEGMVTLKAGNYLAREACEGYGLAPDVSVRVRLIRLTLSSGKTEVLATSLLNSGEFPAEQFGELYHQRWGIEVGYRDLKCPLNIENFSGRSFIAVRQDFYAAQLMKNLASLMCQSQQAAIDHQSRDSPLNYKASLSLAISVLRDSWVTLCLNPCISFMKQVLELIRKVPNAVRPGRQFTRVRRRPATRGCEGFKPVR